jgi:hypothetical protein
MFLNPIAMIGLVAAGIPLLLHLFNLRKLKTIEFSTLSFLKELQKTKIRRLKLRQLLLLILRTLFIILVVCAFSRPTLKGSLPGSLAEQAKTSAVLIIDDSQSMTANDEQGELLHQAKNAALAVMNLLKDGDEVTLLKLSDVPVERTTEIPAAQRNFSIVRSTINEIKPSSMHRSIEDALRLAARVLASSQNFNKEVYLISDFQSGSLESKVPVVKTSEKLFAPTTQFFFVPLGKRESQNMSVVSVEIPNTIFQVNKPFLVKAKLTNHGTSDVQNHVVSVYQDGSRVGQKGVDIHAGQSMETEFTVVPKHSGFLEGKIELEDDDLEFDNTRYFTVHIPEELHVLLVGNPVDLSYLRIALSTRLPDSSASVTVNQVTENRFSSFPLNKTDVVVFSNLHDLTPDQSHALKTYIQNGGGVLFFPGAQTNGNIFTSSFAGPLGISSAAPTELTPRPQSSNSFVEFDKVDLRHPLFSGMFEGSDAKQLPGITQPRRTLESPHITNTFHYLPTPKSQTIITLTNGYPFLLEEQVGMGRLLLCSVPATPEWSDLPFKGLFVPFVHRSLSYLAQELATDRSLLVGDGTTIRLHSATSPNLKIIKPDKSEIIIDPQQAVAEKTIQWSTNDLPGWYTLVSGTSILDKFAVNIDPDESNTAPSDEKHLETIFMRMGIAENARHMVSQPQEVQHIITESRLGAELWKQFLIAALIVALLEMFAARENKQSISGTANQLQ